MNRQQRDPLAPGEHREIALLRLRQVLQVFPVSRSTWWAGVAAGRFPKPVRLGPRCVAWRVRDIRALIDQL
ncbi:MAG TPA: AlpA family phage regulatory protein [Terriglobia bacterium]|nr:AlpA family phage regulatory protein [Terriglobia bacterium]